MRDLGSHRVPDIARTDAGFDRAAALFAEDLDGLTADQVRAGFRVFRQRTEAAFWPTPGQIRKLATAEGSAPSTAAAEVFERVLAVGGSCGSSPEGHARAMEILRGDGHNVRAIAAGVTACGGWRALLLAPLDPTHGHPAARREFRDRFAAAHDAALAGASHLRVAE